MIRGVLGYPFKKSKTRTIFSRSEGISPNKYLFMINVWNVVVCELTCSSNPNSGVYRFSQRGEGAYLMKNFGVGEG